MHPPALGARAATPSYYSADRVGQQSRAAMDALPSGTPEQARELGRYIETMSDCRNQQADSGSPAATRPQPQEATTGTALVADGHIIDGKVAFMGSQNMITPATCCRRTQGRAHWKDLNVKISGEIIVELEAVFAMDWYTDTGERRGLELDLVDDPGADKVVPMQLLPSGPGI